MRLQFSHKSQALPVSLGETAVRKQQFAHVAVGCVCPDCPTSTRKTEYPRCFVRTSGCRFLGLVQKTQNGKPMLFFPILTHTARHPHQAQARPMFSWGIPTSRRRTGAQFPRSSSWSRGSCSTCPRGGGTRKGLNRDEKAGRTTSFLAFLASERKTSRKPTGP